MFKAKDIMQKNVISVTTDTPVFEAITLLVEKGITGLAVVDDDSNLVGILSEKDVLKLLYNLEANSGTVAKYMSPDPICFGEEDSLIDICDCLINNHFPKGAYRRRWKSYGHHQQKRCDSTYHETPQIGSVGYSAVSYLLVT